MKIYLVRHPQTTGGNDVRYFGATDLDLSDSGRRQKAALVERLRDTPLDAIYCSTLRRSVQTAEAIGATHGLTPTQLAAFDELNFGIWEGLTPEEIQAGYPDLYDQWMQRDGTFQYPDGDSVEGFRQRVLGGLGRLTDHPPDATVLLLGHAGVNRVLLTSMMEVGWKGFWAMDMQLASISLVELDGDTYRLALLNDTCHLPELLPPRHPDTKNSNSPTG